MRIEVVRPGAIHSTPTVVDLHAAYENHPVVRERREDAGDVIAEAIVRIIEKQPATRQCCWNNCGKTGQDVALYTVRGLYMLARLQPYCVDHEQAAKIAGLTVTRNE